MRNKRAQESSMGMSFGVIFSIILIIVFIIAAIYGIKSFLDFQRCSEVGLFYDTLQKEVDKAYQSSSTDIALSVGLPSGISRICFANLTQKTTGVLSDYEAISIYDVQDANTFLLPPSKTCGMPYKKILHINLTKIISSSNPYCIAKDDKIRLQMNYGDRAVIIKWKISLEISISY